MEHKEDFLKLVSEAKKDIRECSVNDVQTKIERGETFYLVDVREDREFYRGHAAGAVHLGRGIIERDIQTAIQVKDAEIILYCGGGYRSALAAESLQKMGYKNVISMGGGIQAWAEAGLPIEEEQEEETEKE